MDKLQKLDELFAVARNGATVHSFDDTQKLFLSSLTPAGNVPASKKVFTLKNWIIMLTTISAITCTILFLSIGNQSQSPKQNANKKNHPVVVPLSSDKHFVAKEGKTIDEKPSIAKVLDVIEEQMSKIGSEIEKVPASEPTPLFDWNKKLTDDTPYEFPKLTEKEISETRKKKKSMLKALQKFDKNVYAYIPSGTFKYDSTNISVQAFYMSKTEVTNFEYRTFLFDLLMQDRKAEFLIAKPDQSGWVKMNATGGKPFQDYYFSHPAYNDYPVVNVSKEGVELYCKWLSEELRKFVGEKKEGNYNDIRLPSRVEWVKAASAEGKQLPYPWNGQFMRDSKGLFQANFRLDSITNSNLETVPGNDITAPVKSYWPNTYGLYNMSGNVAEMIYNDSNKDVITAGGSWRNSASEVKIYAPDTRKNVASGAADIGFRVVCTFLKQ